MTGYMNVARLTLRDAATIVSRVVMELRRQGGKKGAMKILVIGGGGREHALAWKLCESKRVEKIWCAPGNGGIAQEAECVALDAGDVNAIVALAERLKPDLTVVGPEA